MDRADSLSPQTDEVLFYMQELRRLERFDLRLPARINVLPLGTKVLNLTTENICAGGAFFPTHHTLPEGLKVVVDLTVKRESGQGNFSNVHVGGQVIRSQSDGIAIRFDKSYRISPRFKPQEVLGANA